jgi:hypothetical protein
MARLAARSGLWLDQPIDDSWAFGFWGSELYRADIQLARPKADPAVRFEAAQMRAWALQAAALNAKGEGDQTAFVLRRAAAG